MQAVKNTEVEQALEEALDEAAEVVEAVEIAEQTMLGDLMSLVVEELKAAPRVWQEMNEVEQRDVLYRAENQVREAIDKVVAIIASQGRTLIPALLHKITFEKECKAELHPFRRVDDESMHTLLDAVKKHIFIVVPYDKENIGEDGKPLIDKDQKELNLEEETSGQCPDQEFISHLESARILVEEYEIADAESLLAAFKQHDSANVDLEICQKIWSMLNPESE